jgi:cytochrome c553
MKFLLTSVAVGMFAALLGATTSETGAKVPVAPRLLSQTGLYADAAALRIDDRNRPFSPQYPLWSDGATKRRWVRLPAGSPINVADPGKWELPIGTKFWKEFSFNGRRTETRLLWQTAKDKWVFASYAWNDAQTDAVLASDAGMPDVAEVADGKRHSIPSVSECRSCHDSGRTEILGFNALQLSTDRDPNALHGEPLSSEMVTLRTLVDEQLMTPEGAELVAAPPRIAASSPQARTALGYLSTNCGSCHNRDSSIATLGLILKDPIAERGGGPSTPRATECSAAIATTLDRRGHWVVPEAPEASRMINPGHPESSAIIRRVKSRRPISQMPPIGTVLADRAAIDLLTSWVNNAEEWKQLRARCTNKGL